MRRVAALMPALLPLVLALAPVRAAAADDGSSSLVFEVLTTAVGVSADSTQRPAASIVTGGLVDSTLGYASSAVSSAGASESAAAAFYPGDLVATGPALLCSQFLPCPLTPPAYPLLAQASYPERPTGAADSSSPVGTARASAHEQSTEGSADVSSGAVPGVPVSVGVQTTQTRAWVDAAGAHVRSRTTLHGVAVGPLVIASLDAADDIDVALSGRVTDRPRVALAGITVAGQAAGIDQDGVHLLGIHQGASVPALAAQGIEVRSLGIAKSDAAGAARSTAGGIRVTFTVPVRGVPAVVPGVPGVNRNYLGSLVIGGVGAAVAVGAPGGPLLSALPAPAPTSLAALLLPPAHTAPTAPGSASAAEPFVSPISAPRMATRSRSPFRQPDLALVALVLAVVPTALLGGWRATVSVRRRRA